MEVNIDEVVGASITATVSLTAEQVQQIIIDELTRRGINPNVGTLVPMVEQVYDDEPIFHGYKFDMVLRLTK